jgi:hypothetical protein
MTRDHRHIGARSHAFPRDQQVDPYLVSLRILTYPESGAGDGNRTHGERAKWMGELRVLQSAACDLAAKNVAMTAGESHRGGVAIER